MPHLVLLAGVPRPVASWLADARVSLRDADVTVMGVADAGVVERAVNHEGPVSLVVAVTPQERSLEDAWRHGGWAAGQMPSVWVEAVADDHDWFAISQWLSASIPGLEVRAFDARPSLRETSARLLDEIVGHAPSQLAPPVDTAPTLRACRLLHGVAREFGPVTSSSLQGLLDRIDDADDDALERARAMLRVWARARFGVGNDRLLALSSGGAIPTSPDLAGLDDLWAPPLSPEQRGLTVAVQRAGTSVTDSENDDLSRQLAEARAQAARVRGELDRIRERRSVRSALFVASWTKPIFRAVRGDTDVRSTVTPAATLTADVVPDVLDEPSTPALASIVVCVHNAHDDVQRCLRALQEHTDLTEHTLVVVDDGSDEPTANLVRDVVAEIPGARLIRHDQAAGYTMAATAGIEASDTPFVVLLNSDTVPTTGWLERLLACMTADPRTAVVGPWSNAASWQSVPRLQSPDGGWDLNDLADGEGPDDIARMVVGPEPLWPTVGLVNGFCYLLRRSAFDAVGGFDTDRFPRGYGEEDDLSLRLGTAGYRLRIADDVYVHHAKSKSFTPEGRSKIVAVSKNVLREKHGSRVADEVRAIQVNEPLVRARTAAAERILGQRAAQPAPDSWREGGPSIAWIQPHLQEVGGIRRAITMSNIMQEWGARPALVTPDGQTTSWLQIDVPVLSVAEAARREFDILLVSDPDMVDEAARLTAGTRVTYHLAAYMMYRPDDERLRRFYDPETLHLTNSQWTSEAVEQYADVRVAGVVPGAVDRDIFSPRPVTPTHHVVCYGSSRKHKGTSTIVEATRGLDMLKLVDLHVGQDGLATGLGSGRVFASGAWHEGFNMPPLEAMACGVPVVMTDDGGSRDYARDGHNALVVPVRDAKAMRRGIHRLLDDEALRVRLIEEGLRTAHAFTWERATRALVELLSANVEGGRARR